MEHKAHLANFWIKYYLAKSGLNKAQLARKVKEVEGEATRQGIGKMLEVGTDSISRLETIATILNIPFESFFLEIEESNDAFGLASLRNKHN
jgi:transcriptional regulator with XRE-family HTH domain